MRVHTVMMSVCTARQKGSADRQKVVLMPILELPLMLKPPGLTNSCRNLYANITITLLHSEGIGQNLHAAAGTTA
jgi:hypothetical protein